MIISNPIKREEFEQYYYLRWKILRKPWNQAKGSEKDELEDKSIHRTVYDKNGKLIGCGRLHFNSKIEAQIRYMAVEKEYQGKGVGSLILKSLEEAAKVRKAKYIILNSRKNAVKFYKKYDYHVVKKGQTLFDSIEHYKMMKKLQ